MIPYRIPLNIKMLISSESSSLNNNNIIIKDSYAQLFYHTIFHQNNYSDPKSLPFPPQKFHSTKKSTHANTIRAQLPNTTDHLGFRIHNANPRTKYVQNYQHTAKLKLESLALNSTPKGSFAQPRTHSFRVRQVVLPFSANRNYCLGFWVHSEFIAIEISSR